jgi:DNA modification methylase
MQPIGQIKNIHTVDDIDVIAAERELRYKNIIVGDKNLSRQLVSFQANKQRPVYRWYKFKEGFSAGLIYYLFNKYNVVSGDILDPFAGAGTALFASKEMNLNPHGIELLPIGQEIIRTRNLVEKGLSKETIKRIRSWIDGKYWNKVGKEKNFLELRITRGAYPEETKKSIGRYLYRIEEEPEEVRQILSFALLSVLESISFTRKDGQYLRWDYRSGRTWGKKRFTKGKILSFDEAVADKLNEIINDLNPPAPTFGFLPKTAKSFEKGETYLYKTSCLEQLPKLKDNFFSSIITSPPYCNRYDYTRTYALELALLGIDEAGLTSLRQKMLSCTVENKEKDLVEINPAWTAPLSVAKGHELLQSILYGLQGIKDAGMLNNNGIIRMVKGYFYEMSCVIYECFRVLKNGGRFFMVNDNVKYAGISIPVDLILSDFASSFGFDVENILVLPQGKGNSSQQMGRHGREALRKCVYVWRKKD